MPFFSSGKKTSENGTLHSTSGEPLTVDVGVQKKHKKMKNEAKNVDTPSPVPLASKAEKDAWQSMQSLEDALVANFCSKFK